MHKRTLRGVLGATAIATGLLAGLPAMAAAQAATTLSAAITPVPCSTPTLVSDITAAASGDTLVLASNCTYSISSPSVPSSSPEGAVGLPIINKVLTMVGGPNTTITRTGGTFRILEVAGSPTAGLTLRGITISNGKASGFSGIKADGGCILAKFTGTPTLSTPTTLVLRDSSVEDCAAGTLGSGGGVYLDSDATAQIIHSSLSDNTANVSGGGLYLDSDARAQISGSRLTGNTAKGVGLLDLGGGGIFVDSDATARIGASVLADNSATLGLGGGIHVDGSIILVGTQLLGNSALLAGGGIYVDSGGLVRMHGGLLTGNTAAAGGGIYVNGGALVTAAAPTAAARSVATDGVGGILRVTGSSIQENAALNGGGVYVNEGGVAVIDKSSLHRNTAGLLLSSAPNSAAVNAKAPKAGTVNKISLPGHGGFLYNLGNTRLTLDTIVGNRALLQGGGIFTNGRLVLGASLMQANRALISGGGVYADSGASSHFAAVQFQLNVALVSGGAIFNAGHAYLQNSFVEGNISPLGGGIYEARPLGMLVFNSLIFGNTLNNCRPINSVPLCVN